eukprot:GDKJ01048033.1.p1 GENE.GDKJ01048033.1~~GDKJ01048033.1.p1  ORF type:complete len:345 (-),score=59.03 GDKJ01048033.1:63-1097(-)
MSTINDNFVKKVSLFSIDDFKKMDDQTFIHLFREKEGAIALLDSCSFDKIILSETIGSNVLHAEYILERLCSIFTRDIGSTTAFSLLKSRSILTRLDKLDLALGGGLKCGLIYEFVGAAGSGKTQFCHLAAARIILSELKGGLSSEVIWLDTENTFSVKRIMSYLKYFSESEITDAELKECLSRLKIIPISSIEDLHKVVHQLHISSPENMKLLVIDSIGHIGGRSMEHIQILGSISLLLKKISNHKQIPILATNQVVGSSDLTFDATGQKNVGNGKEAALGVMWAHAVNVRIAVKQALRKSSQNGHDLRTFDIVKSSHSEQSTVTFFFDQLQGGIIVEEKEPI